MKDCTGKVLLDDAQVRVTRYDFAPGGETGWHQHEMDYVIVTLTECRLAVDLPGGETVESTIPPGASYRRPIGTEHNVRNNGAAPMAFVEVELKR
ncbi:cupin domain-containing protein [Paracoccus suum]|uniref:Cupin domain-containing protein n=1 Tax=Paracoccus suum TaxID=2259340 RepID=A0A344PLT9_9RHOB|nr:cupin domain-containing protein [Paracoccus suum]AXC50344.1 cupin domain-containing protein [Paracoccus suum]